MPLRARTLDMPRFALLESATLPRPHGKAINCVLTESYIADDLEDDRSLVDSPQAC